MGAGLLTGKSGFILFIKDYQFSLYNKHAWEREKQTSSHNLKNVFHSVIFWRLWKFSQNTSRKYQQPPKNKVVRIFASYFRLISGTTTESPWCPSVFHQLFWCHTFLSQSRELCLHYVRHPIFLCVVKLCCLHRKWASDTGNTSGIPYYTCSCVVNSLYTVQWRLSLNFVQE